MKKALACFIITFCLCLPSNLYGQQYNMKNNFGLLKTRDGFEIEYRESFSANKNDKLPAIFYCQGSGFSTLVHPLLDTIFSRITNMGFVVYTFNKRGIKRDNQNPSMEIIDTADYSNLGFNQYLKDAEDEVEFILSKFPFSKQGYIGFGQSEGTLIIASLAEKFPNQTKALFNIGVQVIAPGLIIEEQLINGIAEKTILQFDENKDSIIDKTESIKIPKIWNDLFYIKPLDEYISNENKNLNTDDLIRLRYIHFQKVLSENNDKWFLQIFKTGSKFIKEALVANANEQKLLRINCTVFIFNGEKDEETLSKYVLRLKRQLILLNKTNFKIYIEPGLPHSLDLNSNGKPFYKNLWKELSDFSRQFK